MNFTELYHTIFQKSITDYHLTDDVDAPINNIYELKSIEYYLYLKNWIDTVQWHLEDIIRDPHINAVKALEIKRNKECRYEVYETERIRMPARKIDACYSPVEYLPIEFGNVKELSRIYSRR